MEDIRIFLNDQGLTQKEIAVYLGCLKQGDGTVLQIAKQAQVKRPTAYLILEDLVKRGFVNSKKNKRSIHYFPTHPKRILTRLKNQLQTAESVMPQIMSSYNDSSERPSVAIY